MPIFDFTAFYPSRPFWAGSEVNFDDQSYDGWFHNQMAEEVFSQSNDTYTMKVCRDGLIMLRIEALEQDQSPEAHPRVEAVVRRWGEYLDYLNAFYLLLDSSTLEIFNLCYFNLHEITNRDAFRVRYEDGKSTGESSAPESIAAVFQMARYSSSYPPGIPIQDDPFIAMRGVITLDMIKRASGLFDRVVASPGLEKTLASFAKSLSEYKVGNYETSVVLSWFIIEAAIQHLWETHLASLNCELQRGRKRINRDRRDYLTGRDFPISLVSNLLELWDVLPNPLFRDIDTVRGFRNRIVHPGDFEPSAEEAQLTMKTAHAMIERQRGLHFIPNTTYSVSGQ
jgi:hypothetical protein